MSTKKETATSKQEDAVQVETADSLARSNTAQVDNYHGLNFKILLVYFSMTCISAATLANLVGSAAFARQIQGTLKATDKSIWLSQSIAIITAVLGPIFSQAADYWGRKWFIVVTTACGFIGTLVIARADSMGQAIAGQVVAGLAFGTQPLIFAVASEILPRKWRPVAQGFMNVAGGLGGIFTLTVGSLLVQDSVFGWRNFFYIVCGALGLSAIVTAVLYNPPPRELQTVLSQSQKLARLDWIAYILLAIGLTLLSMGLTWSDNPYPWIDPHTSATFAVGLVLLLALVVHQIFIKKDGLFNHELFKRDRNFAIGCFCIFMEGMVFWAANNYFPFEISVLYGSSTLGTGVRYSMFFIVALVFSLVSAYYCSLTRTIREPIVLAFVCFLLFSALMSSISLSDTSNKATWGFVVVLGVGTGCALTCIVAAAQLSTPPAFIAVTSGLIFGLRSLGGSIALPIYGAILNAKLNARLGADIAASVLPLGFNPRYLPALIGGLAANDEEALGQIPEITPEIIGAGVHGLRTAYLAAFKYIWVVAAVFSAVGLIASVFFKNPRDDFTKHVDAPLDKGELQADHTLAEKIVHHDV